MSTKPGELIGTKLYFQMNYASIYRTMMAVFVLGAMPINTAFENALSNSIEGEHPELWSGVRFWILDDPICYELRVISITTGTSVKCYSPKSSPFFKASLELSFSRIIQGTCCKDCSRLLFSPTHATSYLACLFSGYVAYWIHVGFGWSTSRSWSVSCCLVKRNFGCMYK